MSTLRRPPRGANLHTRIFVGPEYPPLAQVIPFPSREAALERGLAHLFRAHALSPAHDPLVRFSAASSADRALSAFEEALHPFGLRASRDEVDQAAIGAWFDAAILSARLRSNPPSVPSSALMQILERPRAQCSHPPFTAPPHHTDLRAVAGKVSCSL
jgi:hypothetical protein